MYKLAKPFFIIAETPFHAGSGQDLGMVDMPIQRERHTDFPKIEGSGLKGSIRKAFEELLHDVAFKKAISLAFGPEEGDAHAGAFGFTDACLLLFPVKSMKGIFAWITCPKVLDRFNLDLQLAKVKKIPTMPAEKNTPNGCKLFFKDDKIILEEYTFAITTDKDENGDCSKFTEWLSEKLFPNDDERGYQYEKIKKDVVVLSDDDFRDFVNLFTEVTTRTKINNETGTVEPGALFTEEYLPTETIMYSLALSTPIFNKDKDILSATKIEEIEEKEEGLVMKLFSEHIPKVMQIGGNATIGKGIVQIVVLEDNNG